LLCEQAFRPLYLQLQRASWNVVSQIAPRAQDNANLQPHDFTACLIMAGKFKAINQQMIDRAHAITRAGGPIIVAGEKNSGIGSLRKWAAGTDTITDSMSKFHSVVFALESLGRSEATDNLPPEKIEAEGRSYFTAPGLFSSDIIDAGSHLLATHFDDRIKGKVADLGSGWGYLSAELLARSHNVTSLDLYEADCRGIDISRLNLADVSKAVEVSYNWHDVASETIAGRYDWVIMNPPFHTGRDTSTELGRRFIQSAAAVLNPKGKLLMVANRHLAYESTLGKCFSAFKTIEHKAGFKIIFAQK